MSISIKICKLSDNDLNKINEDLTITLENKFSMGQKPKYIQPFILKQQNLIIPFAYGCRILKLNRPVRNCYSGTSLYFNGCLREEQVSVKDEAINIMSKTGSVIISANPGFGKCLKFNTEILMYNGTIKLVQDICVGDIIMGDDSMPRVVYNTCVGNEQMYDIIPDKKNINIFGCNESHILSLKIIPYKSIIYFKSQNCYIVKYFNKKLLYYNRRKFNSKDEAINFLNKISNDNILDISVKNYLKLSEYIKNKLRLYHVEVEFNNYNNYNKYNKKVNNSYIYGILSSIYIPIEYKCSSKINRLRLLAGIIDSKGKLVNNLYYIINLKYVNIDYIKDILYIIKSLGFECYYFKFNIYYLIYIYGNNLDKIPVQINKNKIKIKYTTYNSLFGTSKFKIIPNMKTTKYYGFTIDGNNRFLLGDFTVTHNTSLGIFCAIQIKLKTIIIINKIILIKQWIESINKFCPQAKVQILSSSSKYSDEHYDFYIVNAQNVEKIHSKIFTDIGFCIVDEAHLIMAETLFKSLQFIYPRYLLGLTATPYRPDGLDNLLTFYFGQDKIIRKLYRKHTVYMVKTGYKPPIEKTIQGRLNWGALLDCQAKNEERNNLIIKIIQENSDRNFLVLVKRVTQGEYLYNKLLELKEYVTELIGSNQEFDKNARILIGTCQKVGVGFDHSKLDTLILATDIEEYFIQYLGRIFRSKDSVEPVIYDLLDDNPTLLKHFNTRKKVYKEHGGEIIEYLNKI